MQSSVSIQLTQRTREISPAETNTKTPKSVIHCDAVKNNISGFSNSADPNGWNAEAGVV